VASFLRCTGAMSATPTTPQPSLTTSRSASLEVASVDLHRRASLIEWLDDGLRAGRHGRLEAEYPVSLQPNAIETHRAIYDGDRPISHAMYHVVTVRAPLPIRVGMIGLVYTDPAARGQGLARRCIESCCEALEHAGAAVALLWSDKPAFYERLGFHPFGEEERWIVDAAVCHVARRGLGQGALSATLEMDTPQSSDWASMEALYASKLFRVDREPGQLERLAAAPETFCVVVRSQGRVLAYAALGRGDDFQGVVHEWAGAAQYVLACLEVLCAECGPLFVQAGPGSEPMASALDLAGARSISDSFALARVLDPARPLPSSLYLWGFDSI